MLTAWYQVFVSIILNIAALINVLIRGNCTDPTYHSNYDQCEEVKVIVLILILIVFILEVAVMVYFGITSNRFVKEYEEEHKDELDAEHRLLT